MKQKRMTAIALVCGALCAACVLSFMNSVQAQADAERNEALARYGGEQVEVCVAARDIPEGQRLDASAVKTELWLADLLPEGALNSPNEVVGQTATSPIFAGEVIVAKRFDQTRSAVEIPDGLTALSVPAKTVQAVGGAIRAGMHVDLYASGSTTTDAIARDVLVVDTSVEQSDESKSDIAWITIAVDPASVQQIVAAANTTELHFALPASGATLNEDE